MSVSRSHRWKSIKCISTTIIITIVVSYSQRNRKPISAIRFRCAVCVRNGFYFSGSKWKATILDSFIKAKTQWTDASKIQIHRVGHHFKRMHSFTLHWRLPVAGLDVRYDATNSHNLMTVSISNNWNWLALNNNNFVFDSRWPCAQVRNETKHKITYASFQLRRSRLFGIFRFPFLDFRFRYFEYLINRHSMNRTVSFR